MNDSKDAVAKIMLMTVLPTLVIVEGGYFLSVVTITMTMPMPIMELAITLTRWYRSKTRMTELAAYQ